MKKISVIADRISVSFPIFDNAHRSLKNTVLNISTGGKIASDVSNRKIVNALDSLTFKLEEGARLGIMGHNGSGKTTLLRVLAGIYSPTAGQIKLSGRISSLLDVSMGLDQDATGYENIYLRGVLEGLKPKKIKDRIDEIADFSDLGEYLNFPIRTYSSGMMLRLAFAISTSIEAEILIMDEWLSVGDAQFSKKATDRLNKLINKASILIIASHDKVLIESMCNRLMHLDHGKIVEDMNIKSLK
jgi:lipopolysaccharide transport system ATP-binding protein